MKLERMTIILFAMALVPVFADQLLCISERQADGNKEYILENSLLKAVFSTKGGRLRSLVDKRNGLDYVWDNGTASTGAFKDQFPPMDFSFRESDYAGEILQNSADRISLRLRSQNPLGKWKFVSISKIYSLEPGQTVLRCDLEIHNQAEGMTPLTLAYWQHNFLGSRNEDNRFLSPLPHGTGGFVPETKTNSIFYRDLIRGWLAMLGKSGNGVAVLPEFRRLDLAYAWYCKESSPLDTLEWRYIPEKIKEGESLKSHYSIAIISDMKTVDGVGAAGCGMLVLPEQPQRPLVPVTAILHGFMAREADAALRLGDKVIARQPVQLLTGKTSEYAFELPVTEDGVYPLQLQIYARGSQTLLFDLNKTLRVAVSEGDAKFSALEKRLKSADEPEVWQFDLSDVFITPHFQWMDCQKRDNVLFLVPTSGSRDIIEMKQRMNFAFAAPTVFPKDWMMSWRVNPTIPAGSNQTGTEFVGSYLQKRQWNAIVIGSETQEPWNQKRVYWSSFPQAAREAILRQVSEGAGLLYVNPEGEDERFKEILQSLKPAVVEFQRSMDFSAAPGFGQAEILSGTLGRGRIVVVRYPRGQGFLAPMQGLRYNGFQILRNDHRFQEYQFAILCRLLHWSMGKDLLIHSCKVDGKALQVQTEQAGEFTFTFFNRYSDEICSVTRTLDKGMNNILLPALPAGKIHCHVRLGNQDFAFVTFQQQNQDFISGIEMAESFAEGAAVAGKIVLSENTLKDCRLLVEIIDNTGRLVYRTPSSEFFWQPVNAVVSRHTLVAKLYQDEREVDCLRKSFHLPWVFHSTQNFTNMIWVGSKVEYAMPYCWELLRQFGFNFLYCGGTVDSDYASLLQVANCEVGSNWHAPASLFHNNQGLNEWQKSHDRKYLERAACPNNPKYREMLHKTASADLMKYFGTRHVFQLGDEMSMTYYNAVWDICFCDFCLMGFRGWLKQRYASLESLNKEWGRQFQNWDEVKAMTRIEIMSHPSPAPWVEHRLYMDQLFADSLNIIRQELQKQYPGAIVGPTGVNHPPHVYGGNWNFWNMKIFDCASIYGTGRIPLSFNRDKRLIMSYRGYSSPEAEVRRSLWEGILSGERGTNSWMESIFVLPDIRESSVRQYYKELLWELRSGLGDLLYHSQKVNRQVAILHSQNSLISNFLKQKKTDYYEKELCYARVLEDLGIAARFVAPEELCAGILSEFQALILPEASALSDQEGLAIRNFVSKGGIILADYEVGTQTQTCTPRKQPLLNDLFGIQTKRFALRKIRSHNIPDGDILQAGSGVHPAGGKALYQASAEAGDIPLVITNTYGKGKTVLLNFSPEYNSSRIHQRGAWFAKLLDSLLSIQPVARVQADTPVMHSFYENGKNLYIGLQPATPLGDWETMTLQQLESKAFSAELKIYGREGYAYDVRKGQYLGFGSHFKLRLVPGEGSLIAFLPYRVERLQVELPSVAKPGDSAAVQVVLKGSSPDIGQHVFLMTVQQPDGKNSLEYRKIQNTLTGQYAFTIPFALNDQKGKWLIRIKDGASGMQTQKEIELIDEAGKTQ